MKINRCYHIPPLYDIEVELDCELHRTFAGTTLVVTGMKVGEYDLYDHPRPEHADVFLRLAHIIQDMAEADDTILDDLLEDDWFNIEEARGERIAEMRREKV